MAHLSLHRYRLTFDDGAVLEREHINMLEMLRSLQREIASVGRVRAIHEVPTRATTAA